jgi:DNA polymerase III subunit delta
VKANAATIGRAVDQPNPATRFYLFHGPDESQSRAFGARLLEALGAAKFILTAGAVKSDPAALVDEANAMSLFGGRRAIWIEPATKDIEEGVEALLAGPPPESPVVAIAGALTTTSTLRKLAEGSPQSLAFAAYAPEGESAQRMVTDLGRRFGLKIGPAVAARVAETCGNDQAIIAQELQKLALYVGASTEGPRELEHQAIDEVGTEGAEGDFQRLADLALGGEVQQLADELARLPAPGSEAIPIVRSLQRRLLMLAPMRARIERGERLDAVMTSTGRTLFFKEKAKIQRMLTKWSAGELAKAAARIGKLERALVFTAAPEREALGEELLAIARKARSLN